MQCRKTHTSRMQCKVNKLQVECRRTWPTTYPILIQVEAEAARRLNRHAKCGHTTHLAMYGFRSPPSVIFRHASVVSRQSWPQSCCLRAPVRTQLVCWDTRTSARQMICKYYCLSLKSTIAQPNHPHQLSADPSTRSSVLAQRRQHLFHNTFSFNTSSYII